MPIVSLDTDFEVYASVEEADVYADAALHGDTWRASDEDTKGRALVTATRTLDRQNWVGEKTYPDQELEWPRKETGIDAVDADTSAVPEDIINASIELAMAMLDGSDVQNESNTVTKLQSIRAGSVSLQFYHGADGTPQRFPQIVQELVAPYLENLNSPISGVATGTDGESLTENDYGLTQGF